MYENYQRLQKGSKDAIPSSEMIALSEQMVENSEKLYKNRDSETNSPNIVEEKLKPTKPATPENLTDFTDKQTIDSIHKIEKKNLEIEELALNGMKENVDKRRSVLEERKKRLLSRSRFLFVIQFMRFPPPASLSFRTYLRSCRIRILPRGLRPPQTPVCFLRYGKW